MSELNNEKLNSTEQREGERSASGPSAAKKASGKSNHTFSTTLLLVMIALVCAVAATVAWFSIADNAKLTHMRLEITSGKNLRFDTEEHSVFEDYARSLSAEDIHDAILAQQGVDTENTKLMPLTTSDGLTFTYEDGETADPASGEYLEYTLHFMSDTDMYVYLTSEDGENGAQGTFVTSENAEVPEAMRISFTGPEGTVQVLDPGMEAVREEQENFVSFGLFPKDQMLYNNTNMLFKAPAGVDVPVTVRIWVEGTDEACTNNIKQSDFSVALRFVGRGADGEPIQ